MNTTKNENPTPFNLIMNENPTSFNPFIKNKITHM